MNQANLSRLILPVLLLPLALFAIVKLLTDGGNQLGNTFFLLIIFGGLVGLVAPKAGLLMFFVLQFYVDFLKRLLIIGDSLSSQDVMTSLGMGPSIIIAACFASVFYCATGKVLFFNKRDIIFFCGCVGVSLLGLFLGRSGSGFSDLQEIAQSLLGSAMLGMTAFATYTIIHDRTDQHRVLKYITIGAIPMALYAFHQQFIGISGWEEKYIKTGLSKILYTFYNLDGIDHMRPFSTLNTHTALGAVSAILFLVASVLMAKAKRLFGTPSHFGWSYIILALLFLGSCYLSKNRTTYGVPILGLLLVFIFRGWKGTILFYSSCVAAFVLIVINSQWINNSILGWSADFESTAIGKSFGTLGTYQARLSGFMELNNPVNWTPFGLEENLRPLSHDQITETLLKVGYVPLFMILLTGATLAFWWHKKCLQISDPIDRKFMICLTAIIVSLGICGVAYGNLLFVAPVNSLLGAMIGLGMATIRRDQSAKKTPTHEAVSYQTGSLGPANKGREGIPAVG